MTKLKQIIRVLFVVLAMAPALQASEPARNFLDGVRYYHEKEYDKAISNFKSLADNGIVNGKLFYNLGNACFKAGDTGRAILWYERALKLMPNDPDLKFNYDYVSGFVKDKREEAPSPLLGILFFWKQRLAPSTVQWAGIALFVLFWLITASRFLLNSKRFKMPGAVVLTLALIFIFTSLFDFYQAEFTKEAVIIPSEVSVRSGLTEDSTELFILHAGTRVKVEAVKPGHIKIRFSRDKIGWLKKNDAEII